MIFARKVPEFYIIFARKIFSPNFRVGAHAPAPHPLPPVSYAYYGRRDSARQLSRVGVGGV